MAKRRSTRRGGGMFDWLWGSSTPAAEPVPTGTSSPVTAPPPSSGTTMGGKKRKTRRGGRHRRGKSHKIYGTH